MRTPNAEYAAMVAQTVELANRADVTNEQIRKQEELIIKRLSDDGVIKPFAYVEWQGVYEFEHLPVFWTDSEWRTDGDNDYHCLNVNQDGSIDVFN